MGINVKTTLFNEFEKEKTIKRQKIGKKMKKINLSRCRNFTSEFVQKAQQYWQFLTERLPRRLGHR